jgi:hypothetical protein
MAGGTAPGETRPAARGPDGEPPGTRDPVISVIVAAYNARARIHGALDSLREQDVEDPYEVIVVDSGDDDCAAHVSAAYPEVRLIHSERRLYPGAARNAGIRAGMCSSASTRWLGSGQSGSGRRFQVLTEMSRFPRRCGCGALVRPLERFGEEPPRVDVSARYLGLAR